MTIFPTNTLSGVEVAVVLVFHVEMTKHRGATRADLSRLVDAPTTDAILHPVLGPSPRLNVLISALDVAVRQSRLALLEGVYRSTPSASDSLRGNTLAAELLRTLR